jgi:UV DNA damage endonuclease
MDYKIGYACINQTLGKDGGFKTITVKTANKLAEQELHKKIKGLTIDNLYTTYRILQWNIDNSIFMYRMTSDMIPLATHELNSWKWWNDKDVIRICDRIKELVKNNGVRVSMHPDQFNVVNTDKEEVFQNTVKSLEYHNTLSNMLGNETLILHVGGVKGDKSKAIQRFIDGFNRLPKGIQNKIVLENCDKSFNAEDVLYICNQLNIPMCIDFHHDRCLPSSKPIESYIYEIISTWKGKTPKCHLSTGREAINDKKHADYVSIEDFNRVLEITGGKMDIMLECKEKELALFKIREIFFN